MKLHSLLTVFFASILIGLHTTVLRAQSDRGESLGDYARRMRACENFPPLCRNDGVADAVRQLEPMDEKQLGRFVLRFRDLDEDFPERAEWGHDLFTGKRAFVKAYREVERFKESCQSSQGPVPPDCEKRLAQAQEILTRAKGDFLRNVEVGQDYALTTKPEPEAGKTWEKPSDVSEQTKSAAQRVVEHLVKKVEVENGHLTVGALLPRLATSPGFLVNRLDIYVRNRSPIKHEYTLTARCGTWSQTRSGSVGPSGRGGLEEDLGEPTYSFEVSPPCNLMDVTLDVTSPDEIKGRPQQTSASVVPGVPEAEMAQRLRAIQGSPVGASNPSMWDKVNEACKQRSPADLVNTSTSQLGEDMSACAKAYDEALAAVNAKGEGQDKAKGEAVNPPVPNQGASLAALSCHGYYRSGFNRVDGEVQNISSSPLYKVIAVVSWYTNDGQFIKSESGYVQFDPILPKQVSPFEVVGTGNPAMTRYRLEFQVYGGGTLMMEDRCSTH